MELRPIPGFDPDYLVSACGRLFSTKRSKAPREIKLHFRPTNHYWQAPLKRADGRIVTDYIHRLVALAWLPPPPSPDHIEVDHDDDDKANNRASNLKWITPSGNVKKAVRRRKQRRKHVAVVDPEGLVHEVRNLTAFAKNENVPLWGLSEAVHERRNGFRGYHILADGPSRITAPQPYRRAA